MKFTKDIDEFVLYERLLMNDEAAYNFIYKQNFEKLVRHALFRGIRLEEAEDIAQNTMFFFYNKVKDGNYQKQNNVKIISFLLRICGFLCLDFLKKRESKLVSYDKIVELNTYLEKENESDGYSNNRESLDDDNEEEIGNIIEPYTDDDIDDFLQIPKAKEDERYKTLINNEKFGKPFLLLREAFKTIGKECDERLMMSKGYDFPYTEMSELFDLTPESIKNAVYRCMQEIKSFYIKKGFTLK